MDYQRIASRPASYRSQLRDAIGQAVHAVFFSTVGATENGAVLLDTVPDDFTAAVLAFGRQGMDRAFERIEGVLPPVHRDSERFVVVVSADIAFSHDKSP